MLAQGFAPNKGFGLLQRKQGEREQERAGARVLCRAGAAWQHVTAHADSTANKETQLLPISSPVF